jgi:hypothetical protein
MIRVIYSDKSCDFLEEHVLEEIKGSGRVVAYFGSDGWVNVKQPVTVSFPPPKSR